MTQRLCETSFYLRVCCSGMDKCVMGVQTLVSSFWLGSACINKCNFKSQSHIFTSKFDTIMDFIREKKNKTVDSANGELQA